MATPITNLLSALINPSPPISTFGTAASAQTTPPTNLFAQILASALGTNAPINAISEDPGLIANLPNVSSLAESESGLLVDLADPQSALNESESDSNSLVPLFTAFTPAQLQAAQSQTLVNLSADPIPNDLTTLELRANGEIADRPTESLSELREQQNLNFQNRQFLANPTSLNGDRTPSDRSTTVLEVNPQLPGRLPDGRFVPSLSPNRNTNLDISPSTSVATSSQLSQTVARIPTVIAQTPLVVDRNQNLPLVPPELGFGAVRPPVQEVIEVGAVTAIAQQGREQLAPNLRPQSLFTSEVLPNVESAAGVPLQGLEANLRNIAAPPRFTFASVMDNPQQVPSNIVLNTSGAYDPFAQPNGKDASEASPSAENVNSLGRPEFASLISNPNANQTNAPLAATQIADQIETQSRIVQEGSETEFQFRLDPPELGPVRIRLISRGDEIQAILTVSDQVIRQLIESQLPELRQRLDQSGVNPGSIDVFADSQAFQQSSQNSGQEQQQLNPGPIAPPPPSMSQPVVNPSFTESNRIDLQA